MQSTRSFHIAGFAVLFGYAAFAADPPPINDQLQSAYHDMFDQNYSGARTTLAQYKASHPDNPFGPMSDAATYMLEQFHRMGILESDFFSKDGKVFGNKQHKSPDPQVKEGFDNALKKTEQETEAALRKSPNDVNALLAQVLSKTLRADYEALVEQHGWQALSEIKQATSKSAHLLSLCPECYDAKLSSGVENYILGQQGGVARFFLRLNGGQTNEQKGIRELEAVAEKGQYFQTYAKVLLAIAAKRGNDRSRAKALMSELVKQYPNNTFFRQALKSLS